MPEIKKVLKWTANTAVCGALLILFILPYSLAQDVDSEFTLDVNSETVPLPKVFRPVVGLNGRGFYRDESWPQELAAPEVLDAWQKDIGFSGIYRLQYSLWEIIQLSKDKPAQEKLLANYQSIIKRINDAGGVVILDIFGTPAGLGKILDKRSPAWDLKAFKELIRSHIQELSCIKRYNIWYELWNAPDLDEFFLGSKQEYLNLYKIVADTIKELRGETKIYIPLGGPAVSWWFQNCGGNTIVTPEKSLIYELIKFCRAYRLPLDFISWHAYSTDPRAEGELTRYNKNPAVLIRDWLSYFDFDKDTPLIIDEWNYDSGANMLPERQEKAFIAASYIPARIKNMYEAGIDLQLLFALEDFQNSQEGLKRNVGVFLFEQQGLGHKSQPKAIYNVFKMLSLFGNKLFLSSLKSNNEYVSLIASKSNDRIILLITNYIDPKALVNYLSRNISLLNEAERRSVVNLAKSNSLEKIAQGELEIEKIKASKKVKSFLKKAKEAHIRNQKAIAAPHKIRLGIKNLKEAYQYKRYAVDPKCSLDCNFAPAEEKEIIGPDLYLETLELSPYSVNLIVLNKKPPEPAAVQEIKKEEAQPGNVTANPSNITQNGH